MPTAGWARTTVWAAAFVFVAVVVLSGGTPEAGWSRAFGVSSALVPAGVLAFNRWVWRWAVVRRFHGRPDLQGTWRIRQVSSDPRAPKAMEGYLIVRQDFSTVSVSAVYADSRSRSLSAELRCEDNLWVLSYLFRSEAGTMVRPDNPARRGGAMLVVGREPTVHFEGEYWTDRGTRGEMVSVKHTARVLDTFTAARSAPELA